MGSLPWAHTSFLLQASASCQRANYGGSHEVLAEGRLRTPAPSSVLFFGGEGLVLSLPVLTTGLFCVFKRQI